MRPAQARWLLMAAEQGRAEIEAVLSKYGRALRPRERVRLQLAKAHFEWSIDQSLEVLRGSVVA